MHIGLYFGSFNPIHIGHLVLANHIAEHTDLEEVWIVVSPQNPFKKQSSLLEDYHRFALVELAIESFPKLKASQVEFKLPKPSYTIDTLVVLTEKYPQHTFSIIIGEDNLSHFHKWKNFEAILEHHQVFVYPRPGSKAHRFGEHPNVHLVADAPLMQISSTFIRQCIHQNKNANAMLPQAIWQYMDEMNFYRK
ncbi:MAG: nicotinate (nicotinamide) nucleotide adenylyltransferase [Flavobacteriales bacterium]